MGKHCCNCEADSVFNSCELNYVYRLPEKLSAELFFGRWSKIFEYLRWLTADSTARAHYLREAIVARKYRLLCCCQLFEKFVLYKITIWPYRCI